MDVIKNILGDKYSNNKIAICNDCKKPMTVNSCDKPYLIIGGKKYKRNTVYHDKNKRCHDCRILNGRIHHFGCDMERCPKCKGQLISCGCKVTRRV